MAPPDYPRGTIEVPMAYGMDMGNEDPFDVAAIARRRLDELEKRKKDSGSGTDTLMNVLKGAATGASTGASFGPPGAVIGGLLGAGAAYLGEEEGADEAAALAKNLKSTYDVLKK